MEKFFDKREKKSCVGSKRGALENEKEYGRIEKVSGDASLMANEGNMF